MHDSYVDGLSLFGSYSKRISGVGECVLKPYAIRSVILKGLYTEYDYIRIFMELAYQEQCKSLTKDQRYYFVIFKVAPRVFALLQAL